VDVTVLGSANLDVVLRVADIPRPGETVLAAWRGTGPGGKGANQAIAAARSGARTAFVGAVGDDDGGAVVRGALSAAGVDLTGLRTTDGPTGTAYVTVDDGGENAIVVDPGANAMLAELTAAERALVARAAVVLCQLEVPVATVVEALTAATGLRVLNAAPARALPAALTDVLDVLVVNEHEALLVAEGARTLDEAVSRLLERVPEVLVTLGAAGALVARRHGRDAVAGLPARTVVDTTGAGDVLCGALCAARGAGAAPVDAARLACAAASLSVGRAGAGTSAPTLDEARQRLAQG
jgi:ribokinase